MSDNEYKYLYMDDTVLSENIKYIFLQGTILTIITSNKDIKYDMNSESKNLQTLKGEEFKYMKAMDIRFINQLRSYEIRNKFLEYINTED